jgi:hypothetical protein
MTSPCYSGYRFPADVIRRAVWLYLRFTLSYRDVEELLAERGLEISYETIRRWVHTGSGADCDPLGYVDYPDCSTGCITQTGVKNSAPIHTLSPGHWSRTSIRHPKRHPRSGLPGRSGKPTDRRALFRGGVPLSLKPRALRSSRTGQRGSRSAGLRRVTHRS